MGIRHTPLVSMRFPSFMLPVWLPPGILQVPITSILMEGLPIKIAISEHLVFTRDGLRYRLIGAGFTFSLMVDLYTAHVTIGVEIFKKGIVLFAVWIAAISI